MIDLETLERLDKAATPGPWIRKHKTRICADVPTPIPVIAIAEAGVAGERVGTENAELIVFLRNHTDEIKAALAVGDRLEALAKEWERLDHLCGYRVPNGNDDDTQCLSCEAGTLRAVLKGGS